MKTSVNNNLNPKLIETQENNLFPVFLKLDSLHVCVIGGGNVAFEKVTAIVRTTSRRNVSIIATDFNAELLALAATVEGIRIWKKTYESSDLRDADLVICAVDDSFVSNTICEDAHLRGLLVNVADKPEQCDFYLGSIVQKGHLKIAISTNGKSPTLAKRLREVLSEAIPNEINNLLESVHQLRNRLNGDFASKVRYLNDHTESLLFEKPAKAFKTEKYWKKIAYTSILALLFLVVGNALARYVSIEDVGSSMVYLNNNIPKEFYFMMLTGFFAQLVDGALGMGYGVTCTSVLLAMGIPLPAISGGIHTAEMFSSGASGLSHYKFGNVNKKLFRIIVIPAVLGSFAGAFLLSKYGQIYSGYFRPLLALYTLFLGIKIITNAFRKKLRTGKLRRVGWLGFSGGFLDSIGGGGWGPLVTSTLISKGKSPKYVIGTVSLTEFFVTLVSALTFFIMIGISHWQVVTGLIIGGLIAAPVAAKLSGRLPRKVGFIAVGLLIIIWSLNVLMLTYSKLLFV